MLMTGSMCTGEWMERVCVVLRMGGGPGLHHGEDKQAGHVQVNIGQNKMAGSNQVDVHILSHRTLNQVNQLVLRAANQLLRFALEGRLSLAFHPPDYRQVIQQGGVGDFVKTFEFSWF